MNTITNCPYYLITMSSLSLAGFLKKELANTPAATIKTAFLGIMICLWDKGADGDKNAGEGMKISDLGKCAGVEPSTMTGLLDRMEKEGLVCRANDPDDRRALKVKLTPNGEAMREHTATVVNRVLEQAFAGIDTEALETTKETLKRVLSNIREE